MGWGGGVGGGGGGGGGQKLWHAAVRCLVCVCLCFSLTMENRQHGLVQNDVSNPANCRAESLNNASTETCYFFEQLCMTIHI